MSVLKLARSSSPILRTPTKTMKHKLTKADRKTISNMTKTLMAMPNAIALAAPQVDLSMRVFVVKSKSDIDIIINPTIVWTSMSDPNEIVFGPNNSPIPRITSFWEQCLSFPDNEYFIERPYIITIQFRNIKGVEQKKSYQAWPARVVLHEIDHLDGVLVQDRASTSRQIIDDDQIETWRF